VLDVDPRLFTLLRTSPDGESTVLAIANVANEEVAVDPARLPPLQLEVSKEPLEERANV